MLKYIGLGYEFSLATITPVALLNRLFGPLVSSLADLLGDAKVNRCKIQSCGLRIGGCGGEMAGGI